MLPLLYTSLQVFHHFLRDSVFLSYHVNFDGWCPRHSQFVLFIVSWLTQLDAQVLSENFSAVIKVEGVPQGYTQWGYTIAAFPSGTVLQPPYDIPGNGCYGCGGVLIDIGNARGMSYYQQKSVPHNSGVMTALCKHTPWKNCFAVSPKALIARLNSSHDRTNLRATTKIKDPQRMLLLLWVTEWVWNFILPNKPCVFTLMILHTTVNAF